MQLQKARDADNLVFQLYHMDFASEHLYATTSPPHTLVIHSLLGKGTCTRLIFRTARLSMLCCILLLQLTQGKAQSLLNTIDSTVQVLLDMYIPELQQPA